MNSVFEPNVDEVRDVFAHYGWAMHAASGVEREIAILLAFVLNPKFGDGSPIERDEAFESEASKTFGRLVAKLESLGSLPPNLQARLAASVSTRNWLAHGYYWDHSGHFLTSEGRQFMIRELQRLRDDFRRLDEELTAIRDRWTAKAGVTDEMLQAEMERLAGQGRCASGA